MITKREIVQKMTCSVGLEKAESAEEQGPSTHGIAQCLNDCSLPRGAKAPQWKWHRTCL